MGDRLERAYLETIAGERRGVVPSLARAGLRVASVAYAGAMRARNALYDRGVRRSFALGRPAVSVGNLTAGGTGKTPVVRWLAGRLIADGVVPAVLTRGYAVRGAARSDEAEMLRQSLGDAGVVEVGGDRVAAAARALGRRTDIGAFVLDDAFQHRRARRDVDLVLVNAADPFGGGFVHPRGLLREPPDGLSRATAVLLTHAARAGLTAADDVARVVRHHNSGVPVFRADHALDVIAPAPDLGVTPFYATAGIGHPAGLDASLRAFGATYVGHRWFPDHHAYDEADVAGVAAAARAAGANVVVTTNKDWAKLAELPGARDAGVSFVRVDVRLAFHADDEAALYGLIRRELESAGLADTRKRSP